MSYRFMRVIVFFDLPTTTKSERHEYAKFRKFLIEKGFLMMQESVYCKLALNGTVAAGIEHAVRINRPEDGLVQMLTVTEKQFAKMEMIVGKSHSSVVDSDERLLIL